MSSKDEFGQIEEGYATNMDAVTERLASIYKAHREFELDGRLIFMLESAYKDGMKAAKEHAFKASLLTPLGPAGKKVLDASLVEMGSDDDGGQPAALFTLHNKNGTKSGTAKIDLPVNDLREMAPSMYKKARITIEFPVEDAP